MGNSNSREISSRDICKDIRAGRDEEAKKKIAAVDPETLNKPAGWFETGIFYTSLFAKQKESSKPTMYLDKMPPISVAAIGGKTELVKELLDKGADVNALAGRAKDHTPLDCAIKFCPEEKKAEVVEVLEQHGAKSIATQEKRMLDSFLLAGLTVVEVSQKAAESIVKVVAEGVMKEAVKDVGKKATESIVGIIAEDAGKEAAEDVGRKATFK